VRKGPVSGPHRPEGSHPQDRTACPAGSFRPPRVPSQGGTPDGRTALAGGIASGLTWSFRHDRLAGTDPREPDGRRCQMLLRKEVIQPHLPVRLPCYDFTPIAGPTFGSSLPKVGPLTSGVTDFRGVTGGVYKARERIHRGVADPRLLATPTSRGRVADPDPN
jgi:hypothetical protein